MTALDSWPRGNAVPAWLLPGGGTSAGFNFPPLALFPKGPMDSFFPFDLRTGPDIFPTQERKRFKPRN